MEDKVIELKNSCGVKVGQLVIHSYYSHNSDTDDYDIPTPEARLEITCLLCDSDEDNFVKQVEKLVESFSL